MRKALLSTFAVIGLLATAPAQAQAQGLELNISQNDPLTKLPPDKWVQLAVRMVNAAPIVGKDSVYAVNATGEDISTVMCGKYFLVGADPYITSNVTTKAPAVLPKWTVTLIPTEGFNKYCKDGVYGVGIAHYRGVLNAPDKSFQNSTFVVFEKAN